MAVHLTAVSMVVMLWLARTKHRIGEALGSRAMIADAQQTYACWYLSIVALAGSTAVIPGPRLVCRQACR